MSTSAALRERAALLGELGQIVQAMKNIAMAELQRVARVLDAQRLARGAVLESLAALGCGDDRATGLAVSPPVWLAIGTDRGLCGAFNARVAQEVAAGRRTDPSARYFVAGGRLADLVGDADGHLQGCASVQDMDGPIGDWMVRLQRESTRSREGWLLYTGSEGMVRERLWPWPVQAAAPALAPLRYLPTPLLCDALRGQAMRLSLQAGLCASLQQENHWRLAQMQRAHDHLDELGQAVRRRASRLRQSDITNELETLMTSIEPSAGSVHPVSAALP